MDSKELLELMVARRSIRAFKPDPVPDEIVTRILEAARWCQSASNRQPWRFIVIKNRDLLTKISKAATYGKFIADAPLAIAIIANSKTSPNWHLHDTSMVAHQMALIAWADGVGTCWIGSMNRVTVGLLLNIKVGEFVTTVLPFGYPKGKIPTSSRNSLESMVETIE
jgi:nitroreductase